MSDYVNAPADPSGLLKRTGIGLWAIEREYGRDARVFADDTLLAIAGLKRPPTPEETAAALRELVDESSRQALLSAIGNMTLGNPARARILVRRPDGTAVTLEISGAPGTEDPQRARLEGVCLEADRYLPDDGAAEKRESEALPDGSRAFADFVMDTYEAAYYIDLKTKEWIAGKTAERIRDAFPYSNDYRKPLRRYIERDVHPDDRRALSTMLDEDAVRAAFGGKRSFTMMYKVYAGGRELYFRCDVIRGADDDHVGVGFINITDEMQAQNRRILGAIPLSSDILSKANIGLWSFELDEGSSPRMYVDEAMLGLIGLTRQVSPEETYHAWYDHIDKDSYDLVADAVEKMVSGEHAEVQYPWHHPDGHTMIVRCGGIRNYKYTAGVRIEGTHQDVTETLHFDEEERVRQIEKERTLANQQRQLKSFGDMVNAALWSIEIDDLNRVVSVIWSDEFRHILGFESGTEDFPNTLEAWSSRLVPEDRQRALNDLASGMSRRDFEGYAYDIEYRLYKKSGEECWYHAVGRMELGGNGNRRLYGIMFDISADKLLEQQRVQTAEALSLAQAASRAKTVFFNNMSHDIRTPMNAIIGYTRLAAEHTDDKPRLMDYISKITRSSEHLLSIINDVLDMSRIEAGKMKLNESPENLHEIAAGLCGMLEGEIAAKNLRFTSDTSRLSNAGVVCDKLRLNQILLNILSNAVKYTPAGGEVCFSVEETASRAESALYVFKVRDTGIGMSADFLKTVFEPFTRANSTTVSGIQGTGLGMAIAKSIADMMGGTIHIDSTPGKGTLVTMSFEFKLVNGISGKAESPQSAPKDFSGKRALLVDDNEINREIGDEILSEAGFKVTTAESGAAAIEKLQAGAADYDVILMDIQMPEMDGYEATRAIRGLYPGLKIPIIALSANAFAEDRAASLEAGMNDHIAKPINLTELFTALAKYI